MTPLRRLRPAWRRLSLGLPTVLGIAHRGFFIPHRYASDLPPAGTRPPYPAMEAQFAACVPRFREVLGWIERHRAALAAIGAASPPEPRWRQSWFPRLDAAAAYVIVRELRPGRLVEVGSGHSTRFFARAARDGDLALRLTAIDPAPRADLGQLPVELLPTTLQAAGTTPFEDLAAGDAVSIDSSHILMPGSDLDVFFGRILPLLPAGCLLQIHDIFLPDDYPAAWDWRGYNEQLAVLPLLLSGGWEVLWSSRYVATRMRDAVAAGAAGQLELPAGALESSLWLRRLPSFDAASLTQN